MARLEIEIGGDSSGLEGAGNRALGILEKLQIASDKLNIELFKATDVATLTKVGEKLTAVTGHIKTYTDVALKSNQVFQNQQAEAALDSLGTKLRVLTGNAQLFGESIKNQEAQVRAYEAAISKLLSAGLEPTDSRITSLKKSIDALNTAMDQSRQGGMQRQFQATGQIIPDLENKIRRLKTALATATDERGIVRYNIRLRQAQEELARLRNLGISTAKVNESVASSLRSVALDASRASRGYNAVGLEFGRIIQDAPFAANNFGAIGNNITRLTEVLPQYIAQNRAAIIAQGGAATSANVLKMSLAGLFTGFGGITIAISLVVSAFTFYRQHVQQTKREQEALTEATQDYVETLRGVERAHLQGDQDAQDELTNLKALYRAYQDANIPIEQRRDAYAQLQQMFPDYFGNLDFEEKATGRTKDAYDRLATSIMATARARAAANILTKNAETQLENEKRLLDSVAKLRELDERERAGMERINRAAGPDNFEGVAAREMALRNQIEKERSAILAENNKLAIEHVEITEDNKKLQEEVNKLLGEGATLLDLNKNKNKGGTRTPGTDKPLYESPDSVSLAGLEGVDRELQKIRNKYLQFYDALSEAAKKKGADIAKINALMLQAEADERKEANAVILAEEERIASEIERIRTESGIKVAQNKQKEILDVLKWYDEEVSKARGNAEILAAIEEGKHSRINAINQKYLQERLDKHEEIRDKIQAIEDKPFKLNENGTRAATRAIEEDLRKRLKAVQDYYDDLRQLHAANPMAQGALFAEQASVETGLKKGASTAIAGDFGKEMTRAVRRFSREFYDTIASINQMADASFTDIFTKLVDGLNSSMNEIFLGMFQKKLIAVFDNAANQLGAKLGTAIAGAGAVGGMISGATKQTSIGGQMVGKGLQGAASGAMFGTMVGGPIGTVIGAAVGALVGATVGLISAKKAQKAERIREQQLLEAQKQTKLLERQNALAYTSSIIGRMTTQGVVTGIEVNEFGQLVTKISGQDLLVVLDRAAGSRRRGT